MKQCLHEDNIMYVCNSKLTYPSDIYPSYPTSEAEEKATNDVAYKLAMALKRERERKAKVKDTA